MLATFRPNLPEKPYFFGDASTTAERLGHILGKEVEDATPDGRIALRHPVVQYRASVNKTTVPNSVAAVLRGIMLNHSAARVGVIGLLKHMKKLFPKGANDELTKSQLECQFRRRIVNFGHFFSGEDKSSNAWAKEVDLLIVLGTPHVPP